MASLRVAAAAVGFVLACDMAVTAEEEWKTVPLNGDPDFTISIPSVVDNYNPASGGPNDLMFFSVSAGLSGDMWCSVLAADYTERMTQAAMASALASSLRETLCRQDAASVSDLSILESDAFNQNGQAAAVCTASYTDSAGALPGRVRSQMVVAAPSAAYYLTCTVEDEDQFAAEGDWVVFWGERVRHIQDSFRLPE
jgi:hypothetical protein